MSVFAAFLNITAQAQAVESLYCKVSNVFR